MSIHTFVKRLQEIMRNDEGVDGDAQRIGQIVWILFLKVYSIKEESWELTVDDYQSIIPEHLRWENWAVDNKDGKCKTGDELIVFINQELFPTLKNLSINENTPKRQSIVKEIFEDSYNYMKNGTLLRQVINIIDEIDFESFEEKHAFNDIYETILKDLQSAGKSGEFYTPRVLTDFIVEVLDPEVGEKGADFSCGTGGFLISFLTYLFENKGGKDSPENIEIINKSIYGIEKKNLPHLLCMTNLLLHDIDEPEIIRGNSLSRRVKDFTEEDKFDVIMMNPPYGGSEEKSIQNNFPVELQSSETIDLFMTLILYRLKNNGRVGIVLPDGFLFGTENAQIAVKKKLLEECNLHTIVRLPAGVFAPYTEISTNVLFFDKTGSTKKIDYYEVALPEGYRAFTKTKPFKAEHLSGVKTWIKNKTDNENSYSKTIEEIVDNNYNLDFKNPNKLEEVEFIPLETMLLNLTSDSNKLLNLISKLKDALEGVEE